MTAPSEFSTQKPRGKQLLINTISSYLHSTNNYKGHSIYVTHTFWHIICSLFLQNADFNEEFADLTDDDITELILIVEATVVFNDKNDKGVIKSLYTMLALHCTLFIY